MKGRQLRALLIERDGPRCRWCRRPTRDPAEVGDLADDAATVDHLDVPKIRRHAQPDRAVLSCRRCNQDRGCLTVGEWRAVLRYRRIRRAHHVLGGVTILCWWMPTLLLALAALWVARLRFEIVMGLGRALVAAGRPEIASRVYGAEIARYERRCRALAGRLQ